MTKFYMAPLEGITGYVYRNAYHACFEPADKYFIPFLNPNLKGKFSSRELNDILPEHNKGMYAVPQIMTNKAEDFVRLAKQLREEFGYEEVNLNLGCPSKTVVGRHRGSGFLILTDELNSFFEQVFDQLDMKVSVKTRAGKFSHDEFEELLNIYNRYPLEELIIHPRVQQDYYKNTPNLETFAYAVENSVNPLCYNGDIHSPEEFAAWKERFPEVDTVMLGRGILKNPGLVGMLKYGKMPEKSQIKEFHDKLYEGYREINSGDRNTLFKMKEAWAYMGDLFTDSKKYMKKIKKAEKCSVYEEVVEALFAEQDIL